MRRHSTDPVALLAGALFVAVGAAYLNGALADADVQARWVLPSLLIALGLGGLLATLLNMARQRNRGAGDGASDNIGSGPAEPLAQEPGPAQELEDTDAAPVSQDELTEMAPGPGPHPNRRPDDA